MSDESSLWKNPGWAKPKRKMDWNAARRRQEEEKRALREKQKAMKRECEERNPEWFKPAG